jgi:flagellar basal-body rod protein FlgB
VSLLNDPFGIHARALVLRDMRSTIIAANLANSDTPNYLARDIDFREVLAGTGGAGMMSTTDSQHMSSVFGAAGSSVMYRIPNSPSIDGNTVEVDREQAAFSENSMRYQATLTFLNSRISGIRKALKGE